MKSEKSRDPKEFFRDIFKFKNIRNDLKSSLLTLCKKVKENGTIPYCMRKTLISTIPKKASRSELKNKRRLFLVKSVRGLLMIILFNSEYTMVDNDMSDSNFGGRKGKSCLNHIWVIKSIIHDQKSSKLNKPLRFQKYDYQQMFHSMNLQEAYADLYGIGIRD